MERIDSTSSTRYDNTAKTAHNASWLFICHFEMCGSIESTNSLTHRSTTVSMCQFKYNCLNHFFKTFCYLLSGMQVFLAAIKTDPFTTH